MNIPVTGNAPMLTVAGSAPTLTVVFPEHVHLFYLNPGRFGLGSFSQVVSALVVAAKFWGESIRPMLVCRFG